MTRETLRSCKSMARKLFPYDRESFATQEAGTSQQRQREMIEAIATEFKAVIDDSYALSDVGVSGFHGRNIKKKLGLFIRLCKEGVVRKGDILCIERVNRLSRMIWTEQVKLWEEILSYGVEIVTCEPRFHVTAKSIGQLSQGCPLAILMMLGYEESKQKSDWVRYAVRTAHEQARTEGKPHGKRCPSWLEPVGYPHPLNPKRRITTAWRERTERVAVIRQIHEWAWNDCGAHEILKRLIDGQYLCWSKCGHWTLSAVENLLTNAALLGRVSPDVRNYKCNPEAAVSYVNYPPIFTEDEYNRTQAALRSRRKRGGRKGEHSFNLLRGLLKTVDGRKLHCCAYVNTDGSRAYYLAPMPQTLRIPYQLAEDGFLACLSGLKTQEIDGSLRPDEWTSKTSAWQAEQAEVRWRLETLQGQMRELKPDRWPQMIVLEIAQLEDRLKWVSEQLDNAKLLGSTSARVETLIDTQSLLSYLAGLTDASERKAALERVRARLPVLIEAITVGASGQRGRSRWIHFRVAYRGGFVAYFSVAVGKPSMPSPDFCRKW